MENIMREKMKKQDCSMNANSYLDISEVLLEVGSFESTSIDIDVRSEKPSLIRITITDSSKN